MTMRNALDQSTGGSASGTSITLSKISDVQCSSESAQWLALGSLHDYGLRMTVDPASQSCCQSLRPLRRAFPPSGIESQWTPEALLPACVIATLVTPIYVPEKETQSGLLSGPSSASRFSILWRTELCNPVK